MTQLILPSYAVTLVAAVFMSSGIGKLIFTSEERSRHFFAMGFRKNYTTRLVARLHPYTEIALAMAMLLTSGLPKIITLISTTIFSALYLYLILKQYLGKQPGVCPCFGPPRPVTGLTVWRNVLLLALSLVGLLAMVELDRSTLSTVLVGWQVLAASCITAVFVWLFIKTTSSANYTQSADYIRFPIPRYSIWQYGTGTTSLDLISLGGPILLIIADHRGLIGGRAVKQIPRWRRKLPGIQICAAVRSAEHSWSTDKTDDAWYSNYIADSQGQLFDGFNVDPNVPQAILLGTDGLLAGGPVYGIDQIDTFVVDIDRQLTNT